MSIRLHGAVVIVTGASKGLGVEIARTLGRHGARLALAARSEDQLNALIDELTKAGVEAIAVPTDVTGEADLQRLIERTEAELGPIDVLVNNAGLEIIEFFEDSTRDEVQRLIDVNLVAPIRLCQLVLPKMLARDHGQIVNVASISGLFPDAFGAVYSASKHGLVGLTRGLRQELLVQGSEVGVSMVCPGYVADTGMVANRRESEGMPEPPAIVGTTTSAAVADAVVRAITHNPPRIVLAPGLPSLNAGIAATFPRLIQWVQHKLGAYTPRYEVSKFRRRGRQGS